MESTTGEVVEEVQVQDGSLVSGEKPVRERSYIEEQIDIDIEDAPQNTIITKGGNIIRTGYKDDEQGVTYNKELSDALYADTGIQRALKLGKLTEEEIKNATSNKKTVRAEALEKIKEFRYKSAEEIDEITLEENLTNPFIYTDQKEDDEFMGTYFENVESLKGINVDDFNGFISSKGYKKDYQYKCKDVPLNAFCNSGLCRTRKHGIGSNGPDAPQMSSLSKYASEPPLWFLDVNGRRVELDTDSLYNQMAFQKACMEKLNLVPPTLRKQDWEQLLNALLKEMVETQAITEASEDTSITGRFTDLLEEFTTHMQQALDREEVIMGRPWRDDDEAKTYFRIKDLEGHLKRNSFLGLSAPKMAQRLRDMGGEPISMFIKGRTIRCWRIPSFDKQDSPFESQTKRSTEAPF